MIHTYQITGMSCDGCRIKVENALNRIPEISAVVTLVPPEAKITMKQHVSLQKLQHVLSEAGDYTITNIETHPSHHEKSSHKKEQSHKKQEGPVNNSSKKTDGKYYCPMHCEGEKTYDKPGNCPVCGMHLVQQPSVQKDASYTCPMHPEIMRDQPGACPICGMDLVPIHGEEEDDKNYSLLTRKFKIAAIFTVPIFIIAMSEMIHGNPLFNIMDLYYWNWVQLILSLPVIFYATWMFFERAWHSIVSWNLNMFTLIGMGAGMAWLFSMIALFFPNIFPDQFKTHHGTVYVYFEAATVILTLVLLGQLLEARAHGKTNSAIKELLKLAPNKATKIINGEEREVTVDDIQENDLLRVKPGEKIPVDGSIKEGSANIDESMITGEPIPIDKKAGDKVSSGTINGNKSFIMIAEKVGSETLLSRIIEMVNVASRSKAPIQKLADKISGYFVPIVVLIALLTFIIWGVYGPDPSYVYAFVNAIAVLIIACPCALGLATPMSVMVGVGKGAQAGVLIKNATSLEKMNTVDVIVIDKTGTITEGKPSVEKVISVDANFSENDILQRIVSLNNHSEHPLSQATVRYGKERNIVLKPVANFEAVIGKGVTGTLEDTALALGNEQLMTQVKAKLLPNLRKQVEEEQKAGKTVSYFAIENQAVGFIVISDKIKQSSKSAIERLQQEGLKVFMFTGDNEDTAKSVTKTLNLDGYKAQMLPEDKLNEIIRLQETGKKVAMAGDGINDAPALSQADVGIAMGTGTDVAIESAAITLVKGNLIGIVKARLLSTKVMRNIKENLFFALAYNVLGIPIAAGILYPSFGLLLSPMIAALAMSFSSVSVIINSLRLRETKLED
ncbi:heavy metal translocating P-type ATPase [Olivibacter sp. SDN3]|uniref:heavy metal translocating P-type ATPase n=1 Tax=Olivibacter sp. SDN3 TaxID=2764720 RepID=UPI0016511EDC|nr:heavy metal translocating P-type ATPase [Olivibacter sp. SDN3]QNL49395.1 heavy metal translocating P-type ATPase [Olivibacter sp. SDN3]